MRTAMWNKCNRRLVLCGLIHSILITVNYGLPVDKRADIGTGYAGTLVSEQAVLAHQIVLKRLQNGIQMNGELTSKDKHRQTIIDHRMDNAYRSGTSDTYADTSYADMYRDHGDGMLSDDGELLVEYDKPTARILVTVRRRSGRYWEPWELNHNICPPSLCTQRDEVSRPRGTAGTVFYNGDIVLDKESEDIIYAANPLLLKQWIGRRRKRATMKTSRTWRHGVVPYTFAENIATKAKSVIRKAMKEIENKTCITFRRKKAADSDYIRFISEPGCWSSVGKVGGEQKLSIGEGCERLGTAIHEISHALGFWHEQARQDRDTYVKILKENISPSYLPDFNKADPSLVTSRGYLYDYESIMHYSEKAFTNLGNITIKVIGIGKKLKMGIGQRDGLSTMDIAQLRDMYHCNEKEDNNATVCPKDWKKNVRSCYKFEDQLKEQFSGAARHCDSLNSKLLQIDDSKEDAYIKRHMKKQYPEVKVWRTGGRITNGTFTWYNGADSKPKPMEYTKWQKGHPGSYTSMAIVFSRKKDRMRWQGVWLGSYSQMPEHAYPFVCERRARRPCIPGQYADGRDYRGKLDHTIDGYTCQKWASQYPQPHDLLPYPFKAKKDTNDGLGDHNYCRNPSGDRKSRPWCYTTKKKYTWQFCDISICSKKLKDKDSKTDTPSKTDTSQKKQRDLDRHTGDRNKKGNNNRKQSDKGANKKDGNRRDNSYQKEAGKKKNRKRNNNNKVRAKGNKNKGSNRRHNTNKANTTENNRRKGNTRRQQSKNNNKGDHENIDFTKQDQTQSSNKDSQKINSSKDSNRKKQNKDNEKVT